MLDVKQIGDAVISAVKGHISSAISGVSRRIDDLESSVKAFTESPPDIGGIVRAEVKSVIAEMPIPKDGKDADPASIIKAAAEAVAALPKPADGKSVTIEDVAPLIADQIKVATSAIPTPRDGKDADPEAIALMVREAFEAMPKPMDGKSITVEDVAPMICDQVKAAIEALPRPQDGKDADPAQISAALAEAIAALPKPADGKDGGSVTVDDVAPLIVRAIDERNLSVTADFIEEFSKLANED